MQQKCSHCYVGAKLFYSIIIDIIRCSYLILCHLLYNIFNKIEISIVYNNFDMVDHNILLKILENQFGVTDTALKWFDSYIRPRSFKVCIGDEYSKSQKLSFGVPQGSCSGANIFTCYCSLIYKEVPELVSINGFADDYSLLNHLRLETNNKKLPLYNY